MSESSRGGYPKLRLAALRLLFLRSCVAPEHSAIFETYPSYWLSRIILERPVLSERDLQDVPWPVWCTRGYFERAAILKRNPSAFTPDEAPSSTAGQQHGSKKDFGLEGGGLGMEARVSSPLSKRMEVESGSKTMVSGLVARASATPSSLSAPTGEEQMLRSAAASKSMDSSVKEGGGTERPSKGSATLYIVRGGKRAIVGGGGGSSSLAHTNSNSVNSSSSCGGSSSTLLPQYTSAPYSIIGNGTDHDSESSHSRHASGSLSAFISHSYDEREGKDGDGEEETSEPQLRSNSTANASKGKELFPDNNMKENSSEGDWNGLRKSSSNSSSSNSGSNSNSSCSSNNNSSCSSSRKNSSSAQFGSLRSGPHDASSSPSPATATFTAVPATGEYLDLSPASTMGSLITTVMNWSASTKAPQAQQQTSAAVLVDEFVDVNSSGNIGMSREPAFAQAPLHLKPRNPEGGRSKSILPLLPTTFKQELAMSDGESVVPSTLPFSSATSSSSFSPSSFPSPSSSSSFSSSSPAFYSSSLLQSARSDRQEDPSLHILTLMAERFLRGEDRDHFDYDALEEGSNHREVKGVRHAVPASEHTRETSSSSSSSCSSSSSTTAFSSSSLHASPSSANGGTVHASLIERIFAMEERASLAEVDQRAEEKYFDED